MRLQIVDLLIIAVYLIAITFFGLRFRKSQRSLRDYFLADRNIPWWAIALSIVGAETSTLTVIGTPGIAYGGNFGFLQLVFGYLLGRIVVSAIFIPQYFRGEMFTAYQLIDRRFGKQLHRITAGIFLITRAAAEGVRVWAVAIVISIALGTAGVTSVAIVMALTLIYTFEGGMAAVIWTDVVQLAIYIGGTIIGFITLLHLVPGGWPAIHAMASSAGKLQVFDFSLNFFKTYTFWAGLIGGMFLNTATHGTDQLMVQRLLVARNQRDSRTALLFSGGVILVQFTLFLLVGAGLWVFYRQFPPTGHFATNDYVFPTFIVEHMPRGIAGLLIAAILAAAMSNLSAALNSLSSTTMIDFYLRRRPDTSDSKRLGLSRIATVVWGLALFGLALASRYGGNVLEKGLTIASLAYGGLLGVFLLGLLTRRATQNGAIAGMLCGLALNTYIWGWTHIAWTWYVTLGSITTFVVGYLASLLEARPMQSAPKPAPELLRELNAWHSTAIVVGTIIGSGIFLVPAEMMQAVGSARLVYLAWIVGGLLSFFGALTYAELGAVRPWAGGEYVYIRDAYGPLPSFLYAWTWFLIAKPASIASVTSGLVRVLGNFSAFSCLPHPIFALQGGYQLTYGHLLAIAATILITALNYLGVRKAGNFQLVMTTLKIVMIVVIIAAGFSATSGSWSNFGTTFLGAKGGMAGFMAALVAALWAYDGWNDLNMVSGEIRNPERSIPIALIAGVAIVAVLYIGVNAAVQFVMPASAVAASPVPASSATQIAIGHLGALLVSAGMALSMFVTLNGTIMSGGRIPFAVARDGYFFKALAEVHPRFHTPSLALIVQCVMAIALQLGGGSFRDFLELAIFSEWLFYMIAASTIFVFRRREPNAPRPYSTWGYPVVPALFVVAAAVLLYFTFIDKLHHSLFGTIVMTLVMLAGIPVFWWFAKQKKQKASTL